MPDDMHRWEINMADGINAGGYICSNIRSEIEFAKATGKEVRYPEQRYALSQGKW